MIKVSHLSMTIMFSADTQTDRYSILIAVIIKFSTSIQILCFRAVSELSVVEFLNRVFPLISPFYSFSDR